MVPEQSEPATAPPAAANERTAQAVDSFNQAVAHQQAGRYEEAITLYGEFNLQFPGVAAGYANLGQALCELGRCEEAIDALETALRLDHHAVGAYNNLIALLFRIGQIDYAEALCWQQLERHAELVDPYINLSAVLSRGHKFEAAWQVCRSAPAAAQQSSLFQRNLGRVLTGLGSRGAEAGITAFRRALALDASDPIGHLGLAEALLRAGHYSEGWAEYQPVLKIAAKPGQPWNGESLQRKTLLLHKDSGFGGGLGDVIHLSRFVPILQALGADITLAVPETLFPLFRSPASGVTLVPYDGDWPVTDYHASLMAVVRLLGTTLATIPTTIPYVSAQGDLVAAWRQRLAGRGGLKVGLVWAGHQYTNEFGYRQTDHRRAALADLVPLLRVPGVTFVSLQQGDARREIGGLPEDCALFDAADDLHDFGDSAALIETLDLVISIDTSTAHLAGALGKPVWILLSAPACWRWMYDREDSPWYPTARLFRQKSSGGWAETIQRVERALITLTGGGGHTVAM
jgi:tetratricopeptide (TPR) repeat protein